ncbi:MAG: ribonuclease J, partial [Patescibacteria group bacterium]
ITIQSLDQQLTLGKFKISFFPVEHSIMDAVGLIVQTPQATIIHPGDWALEPDPIEGRAVSYEYLSKLPSPRVLMLESLGATKTKERTSAKTTLDNIQKLIDAAPGRIIIGTFSSQIERVKHILEYAEQIGKKVALDGYSMKMNIEISKELGYIKTHKTTLIGIEKIHQYPDNKIIIICTGAQGENNASFARIVNNNHRYIQIQRDDTVVFSSSIIPGNEATIQKLKDQIYRLTENVYHTEIMDVHSSGHSTADDIKEVLAQIKPDYFLPVYANYYLLVEAKKIALRAGFAPDKIFVLANGETLEFKNGKPKVAKEKVNTDYVMVDGLGVGDISEVVLRDRQVMSEDGMIVVIATIYSKTGALVGNPDIISRGFIHMKENKKLVEDTRLKAKEIVMSGESATKADENFIKNKLRNTLGEFLFRKTQRRPMVLPVIIKV